MSGTQTQHLWTAKHMHYWREGCLYQDGHHYAHASWSDFIVDMGDADEDYNLLCRWDWRVDPGPVVNASGLLVLSYVAQSRGHTFSHEVRVTDADEPAVRAWLEAKWRHMRRLWAPLDTLEQVAALLDGCAKQEAP